LQAKQAQSEGMPRPCGGAARPWLLPLILVLPLWSCLVIVSTSPTPISNATIVVVAFDDHGSFVASMRVTVVDVGGDWHEAGATGRDGSYSCTVGSGVARVRVSVTPPPGYALAGAEGWPRELDLPADGSVRIEVRVKAG
jgi:hypothetical protein